jgi:hypothetical protein
VRVTIAGLPEVDEADISRCAEGGEAGAGLAANEAVQFCCHAEIRRDARCPQAGYLARLSRRNFVRRSAALSTRRAARNTPSITEFAHGIYTHDDNVAALECCGHT